jgi:hypothetical protein
MAVTLNIPSQVKTYANLAAFPASGSLKTIYIAEDTNKTYRWTGSVYVEISASGDLTGYVPYTGATGNVDLGTHTLSAKNIIVNHASGSGVAVSITKGGAGEALTITKTSGSGNAMSVTGGNVQFGTGFYWDSTNNRLGIGGTPGAFTFDVTGDARATNNYFTRAYALTAYTFNGNSQIAMFAPATNVLAFNTTNLELLARLGLSNSS